MVAVPKFVLVKVRGAYSVTDQSRNGVRVRVTRHYSRTGRAEGTTVQASCSCYGSPNRVHLDENCPWRLKQLSFA